MYNDKTEITPNPKYLRVVLHSIGLTYCKPAPTPSVAGSVKPKPDDDVDLDVHECRLYRGIVGSLQYLSIDRTVRDKYLCEGDETTNKGFMDATETVGTIPGRNPVSESYSRKAWN